MATQIPLLHAESVTTIVQFAGKPFIGVDGDAREGWDGRSVSRREGLPEWRNLHPMCIAQPGEHPLGDPGVPKEYIRRIELVFFLHVFRGCFGGGYGIGPGTAAEVESCPTK